MKADLARDTKQLHWLPAAYRESDTDFRYLAELDPKASPDGEKFEPAWTMINSNRFFAVPQLYERYASAAKLSEKIIQRIDVLYKNAE
ncbi:hypothetical protein SAMN05518865_102341 [Duganella sp. CF458]|uniref:hypothetical protein n=1 Tax=Duganella sp. CF458 TaxID=1884368 RepID=UPI0008F34973|nr:hypothetical protein [Duganella sp. CF458]SFF63451.1 hypothetical protein SAMN05518865_102341 [Duganella sp. CF458]